MWSNALPGTIFKTKPVLCQQFWLLIWILYWSNSWRQWKWGRMGREVLGAAQPQCRCFWGTSMTTSLSLTQLNTRAPLWRTLKTSPRFSAFLWVRSFSPFLFLSASQLSSLSTPTPQKEKKLQSLLQWVWLLAVAEQKNSLGCASEGCHGSKLVFTHQAPIQQGYVLRLSTNLKFWPFWCFFVFYHVCCHFQPLLA